MQATAPAHVTQRHAAIQSHAVFSRRNLMVAGLLSLLAFTTSVAIVLYFGKDVLRVSGAPHYVYQAWSFLHGKWDLDLPPSFIDVITINGKSYTNYPPVPAILMLPFVAIWGLHTSDVLFTIAVSAVNMALLYLLLEQLRASGLTARGWRENVLWCLFFSFGSITLWLSLGGGLWFTAQIVALGTTLLALLLALRGQYAWAGVALGCAVFSRIALLLAFPLLFYLAWNHAGRERLFERFLVSLRARRPDWAAVPWRRLAPLAGVTWSSWRSSWRATRRSSARRSSRATASSSRSATR